jgi:uncharacterized Zn finger protein (UPF0148 family)
MTEVPQACPRCASPLYRESYSDYSCLYCGELVFIDAHPERVPVAAGARDAQRGWDQLRRRDDWSESE